MTYKDFDDLTTAEKIDIFPKRHPFPVRAILSITTEEEGELLGQKVVLRKGAWLLVEEPPVETDDA